MPIDLERELDLGVLDFVDADVQPSEREQLRETGTRQRSEREQRAKRFVGRSDRLLKLARLLSGWAPPAIGQASTWHGFRTPWQPNLLRTLGSVSPESLTMPSWILLVTVFLRVRGY